MVQDDIALVDMANLAEEDTGVAGIIYISSARGGHGARVKWYPRAPQSKTDACLSVTVEPRPVVFNHHLPRHVADAAADPARRWVALNAHALLDYWEHGYSWTRQQVNAFIDGLTKLP